jgi:hypothetical protein
MHLERAAAAARVAAEAARQAAERGGGGGGRALPPSASLSPRLSPPPWAAWQGVARAQARAHARADSADAAEAHSAQAARSERGAVSTVHREGGGGGSRQKRHTHAGVVNTPNPLMGTPGSEPGEADAAEVSTQ